MELIRNYPSEQQTLMLKFLPYLKTMNSNPIAGLNKIEYLNLIAVNECIVLLLNCVLKGDMIILNEINVEVTKNVD